MYYSYVEFEYVATGFSPTRTDLAVKLLKKTALESRYILKKNETFSNLSVAIFSQKYREFSLQVKIVNNCIISSTHAVKKITNLSD